MSAYVTIGTHDVSIKIARELISPYTSVTDRIETVPIGYSVLSTLRKVLSDLVVIPMVDLESHLDVLALIRITRQLGIPDEKLYSGSFKGWTESRRWTELRLPEYMWLVWSEIEELVDFRKYVRNAHNPFDMVLRTIDLPEIKSNPSSLIGLMNYFGNFKLELCFDMNNDRVQAQLVKLRAELDRIRPRLLIDPHSCPEWFRAAPHSSECWPCDRVSAVPKYVLGDPVIVEMKIAQERFDKFTCGLFKMPLRAATISNGQCQRNEMFAGNPNAEFPWDSVVFAGGAATKILSANYEPKNARQSDVDLFIIGDSFEDRKLALDRVLDWFNTFGETRSRTYYAIRGSVVSIYIKDIARKVQIISSNAKNVYDVIGRFDLTHIQWALWKGRYYGTPQAATAMRESLTRFSYTKNIKAYRLIKAMNNGYDIEKSRDIMDHVVDITSLIEGDNEQLQSILRDFHGYYYPTSCPDYEPDEELKHILAMICKDANASLATNDPTYVRQNVVVSGNFGDSYESISFTTFNPGLIMNKGQNRRMTQMSLKTRHGVMRLTSSFLTVVSAKTSEECVKIVLRAETEEFIEFTKLLEGNVYRMFRQGGVTKTLFNNREMTIEIPRYALDAQISRGVSCIRNQRGTPLNIEEDLAAGDRVQFMFIVELVMTDDVRKVVLKPLKFIKYQIGEDHTEVEEDLDAEASAASTDTPADAPAEIVYEEY
jgi:hypothetical protein